MKIARFFLAAGVGLALALLDSRMASARLVIDDDNADWKTQIETMLSRCEEELPSFHELLEILRRSNKEVRLDPVRGADADGVFIDSFGTGAVDLDDLDQLPDPTRDPATGDWRFPPGVSAQAITLCQALAHVLWERFHASFVGGRYDPSHASANDFEGRIRDDYGQDGAPVNHTLQDGEVTTIYRNGGTYVEGLPLGGGDDVGGPPVTTPRAAICLARCTGVDARFQFGAPDCNACPTQAERFCTARGRGLGDYICRTSR